MEQRFTVPIPVPSKSNSYRIHRAGRRQWIAPTDAVLAAEQTIAMYAKRHLSDFDGPVTVRIYVAGRIDVDNAAKCCLDGLQKSGRIGNDRNVWRLEVERVAGRNEMIHIVVGPYEVEG